MNDTSPSSNTLIDIGTTKETIFNQNENNNLERYIWKSGCFQTDKRVVIFFSQFTIALMVISFSLYQLNKDNSWDHQQIYIGLLTMMVGIFLPAPRINK